MAFLSPVRLGLGFIFLSLLFTESGGDNIEDLIQFEEDLHDDNPVEYDNPVQDDGLYNDNPAKDKDNPVVEEDEMITIRLSQLKPKWRSSLTPYDNNNDGKLSGLELEVAYPEIERLIKAEDEGSTWWDFVTSPYVGVVVAIVIGGAILMYALKALFSLSQQKQSERENQYLVNKEQWLSKLDRGNKQQSQKEAEQVNNLNQPSEDKSKIGKNSAKHFENIVGTESGEESASKLHKRKPDAGRDPVTNKIARYQHLSAVRRQPGNQSENTSNNNSGFYKQLLSDDDEVEENSADEVVGNTRKRRQGDKDSANGIYQKVANVSIDENNQNGYPGDEIGATFNRINNRSKMSNKFKNKNSSQVKAENVEQLFSKKSEEESKIGYKPLRNENDSHEKAENAEELFSKLTEEESNIGNKPVTNENGSQVKAENDEQLFIKNTGEEGPRAVFVPVELTPKQREAVITKILSYVLDCKIDLQDVKTIIYRFANQRTMKLNSFHLPAQTDDIAEKTSTLAGIMILREVDKVKYAVTCFDRSLKKFREQTDSVTKELCQFLTDHFTGLVITQINCVEDDDNADDLWADYNTEAVLTSSVHALCRIAGWADDDVVISNQLLSKLLLHQDGAKFLRNLFWGAGKQLMSIKRIDELINQEGRLLKALEILISNVSCGELLAKVMEEEVKDAENGLGNFFEKSSVFGPLLSVSTAPSNLLNARDMKSPISIPFLELKDFPKPGYSDLRFLETTIQAGLHRCQNIVYNSLMTVLKSKSTRGSGLAWLAAVINLNDIRTTWSPDPNSQHSISCSDGFMLNFCPVLIELFMPAIHCEDRLSKVDLDYSASESCRLNFDFEICLAGGQIVSQDSEKKKDGESSTNQLSKYNFLTECFHLCQRGLSVGVVPAISHFNRQLRQMAQLLEQFKGEQQEKTVKELQVLLSLMWEVSLIDTEIVRKISLFYLCQSQLVLKLIDSSEQVKTRKKLLSRIPEFCIKDMCIWFRLVADYALLLHQDVLAGVSLAPFVDCCVALLSEQELMPGPVAASKVVTSLLSFVKSSKRGKDRGSSWGSEAVSNLAMMVFTCPSFLEKLGPALIRIYVSVDVVEGLDVDKDEFDKFSARAEITQLVEELWERFDSRHSILNMVGTKLFQDFLGSVLNTLLYMLDDSLTRVANIRKMELAKDNVVEWQRLLPHEKFEKEKFLKQEERTAKGFMTSANNTLDFIEFLTKADVVAKCFTRPSLAHRAANAILGFIESLCGANNKDYKVKDGQKYNLDPRVLLNKIMSVILTIAKQDSSKTDGFVVSMAIDDDFNPPTLEKALNVISRRNMAAEDSLASFSNLIQKMKEIQSSKSSSKADNSNLWQTEIASLKINTEALCERYKAALEDLRFDASDIQESHSFYGNAQELTPGSSKIKTLMKEMKQLRSNLPVHPDAAVFVCQDEERIDLMRAMLTGPVDTPYSLGCFIFDVYFPNNYPNIPPLVKIITTGNGTVRFNPNLYADGKVCLSLLGTWHAGNASEKWIPTKSSLYQVLVSIQSLILIPDPMFNEPGYEGLSGTKEGKAQSKSYNSKLRLWTVRHAMLGQLRSPPAGFEDLIRQHFTLQKDMVLKQCSDWLNDCAGQEEEKRLRSVVNDLREELAKLEESPKLHEVEEAEESKNPETTESCPLFDELYDDDDLYG